MKEKNFISAVIYVHNGENRIENFLDTINHIMDKYFMKYEIICVNDGSSDAVIDRLRKKAEEYTQTTVTILHMSYFHGLEAAMNAGRDLAIGDFVYEFDSTHIDYEPNVIKQVYDKALEGYDIVSASVDKKPRFFSGCFYYLFGKYTFDAYQMRTESFRILSRRVINRIEGMNMAIPYRKAVYANCGLKAERILYPEQMQKKAHKNDAAAAAERKDLHLQKKYQRNLGVDSLILFTEIGYRFGFTMTLLMMMAAAFMVVYTVIVYLLGIPVEGWTTTMLFLSFGFFGLFGILTVVIKYLSILVDLVYKKQRYRIAEIEKITK